MRICGCAREKIPTFSPDRLVPLHFEAFECCGFPGNLSACPSCVDAVAYFACLVWALEVLAVFGGSRSTPALRASDKPTKRRGAKPAAGYSEAARSGADKSARVWENT
jgi:hypothetical protein